MAQLFLIQHGKPVPKEQNPEKPLSDEGRDDIKRVANFLRNAGCQPKEIYHSGKTRALQTAEIIAEKIGKAPIEKAGLSPLDPSETIKKEIEKIKDDIMLVGHLPHLSRLASLLLTVGESQSVVDFKQGCVVCLKNDNQDNKWQISWMILPELLND
jgi:phosphohistidine phosphatase